MTSTSIHALVYKHIARLQPSVKVFLKMFKLAVLAIVACLVYGQSPPPPPFLNGAPAGVVAEFNQILAKAGGMTDSQIDAAVDAWVAKQSDDLKV